MVLVQAPAADWSPHLFQRPQPTKPPAWRLPSAALVPPPSCALTSPSSEQPWDGTNRHLGHRDHLPWSLVLCFFQMYISVTGIVISNASQVCNIEMMYLSPSQTISPHRALQSPCPHAGGHFSFGGWGRRYLGAPTAGSATVYNCTKHLPLCQTARGDPMSDCPPHMSAWRAGTHVFRMASFR